MNYFHNTTHEAEQLAFNFEEVNKQKNNHILDVFKANPGKSFTPFEVWDILIEKGFKMELTSCRRGISDLEKEGKLINTKVKVIERLNRPNYKWTLNNL